MPEPADDYYRELVKEAHGDAVEARIFEKFGDDDLLYRRAGYNLATTGSESCSNDRRFQEAKARINATNSFHESPTQVQEGVIECPRCKSLDTLHFERQTRSADEAATVYCRCRNPCCNNTWREN